MSRNLTRRTSGVSHRSRPEYGEGRNVIPEAERSHELIGTELDYVLLDGSGSMISLWDQTLACLENYFSKLRRANIGNHGILQVFDEPNLDWVQRDSTISTWPAFNRVNVDIPGGGTPLYDAVNIAVRRLAELAPQKCTFIIVTDGDNNGSRHTTADEARALLDWCRAQGWQVIFLGADFDNMQDAVALGAREQEFIGVQRARLHEAGDALADKRIKFARTGEDIGFDGDEKQKFGGYLAGPSKS